MKQNSTQSSRENLFAVVLVWCLPYQSHWGPTFSPSSDQSLDSSGRIHVLKVIWIWLLHSSLIQRPWTHYISAFVCLSAFVVHFDFFGVKKLWWGLGQNIDVMFERWSRTFQLRLRDNLKMIAEFLQCANAIGFSKKRVCEVWSCERGKLPFWRTE